jgi:hypothetical protein
MHYRQFRKDNNLIYPNRPICNAGVSCKQPDSVKPDIYFIIFDGYTNNRTLQQLWQFDNSSITNWLSQKGFYIPDSSKANFNFTPYSISSILNMNYPAVKRGDVNSLPAYYLKAVRSMSDNETLCLLQKEHYNVRFISPINNAFENLGIDKAFDHFAEKKLYNHTLPGRLRQDLAWHFTIPEITYEKIDHDYNLIISKIKSTADSVTNRPPQFVYGHLMITHKPNIYDSSGNVCGPVKAWTNTLLFNTYTNQVKQANKRIQELVDHILTHNKKNTLIIIMGDHGFRDMAPELSRFYFPNFSAFYFPDKKYGPALRNISAVNTFRIVFNQYFCQNLPLLKDSSILVKY